MSKVVSNNQTLNANQQQTTNLQEFLTIGDRDPLYLAQVTRYEYNY
jgi:hypothetical protein